MSLAFGKGNTKGCVMNMLKWKQSKFWISIICVVLCTVIFEACTANPRKANQMEESNLNSSTGMFSASQNSSAALEALQQCRTVLEQIQSYGSCKIETEQKNGSFALNETTDRTDWVNGDNRLIICIIPESGGSSLFGGLHVNGASYECDSMREWREISRWEWKDPWLSSFRWDDSSITYLDTRTDDSGTTVMLRIDQPFAEGEDQQNHYFVDFIFDADGTFRKVYLQTNISMNNAISKTESIASVDAELIKAEIQKEYQNAIGQ